MNHSVEISQMAMRHAPTTLRLIPALLVKAGFGLSAFGRLPDREYLKWVLEINGLAANMRGALDRFKGPADLVFEAQAAEAARTEERRNRVLAHLRHPASPPPPGDVLREDKPWHQSEASRVRILAFGKKRPLGLAEW